MNDKQLAQERFVASDGIGHGISQCMRCNNFKEFNCLVMPPSESGKYMSNKEDCPRIDFKEIQR